MLEMFVDQGPVFLDFFLRGRFISHSTIARCSMVKSVRVVRIINVSVVPASHPSQNCARVRPAPHPTHGHPPFMVSQAPCVRPRLLSPPFPPDICCTDSFPLATPPQKASRPSRRKHADRLPIMRLSRRIELHSLGRGPHRISPRSSLLRHNHWPSPVRVRANSPGPGNSPALAPAHSPPALHRIGTFSQSSVPILITNAARHLVPMFRFVLFSFSLTLTLPQPSARRGVKNERVPQRNCRPNAHCFRAY